MFLRNKINFVTLKSRFGGTRSRLPRNGYIRQLGETSWGPPGRKLCYVKSHFGGTRSRFPRNGYIRQSGESCRVEARQGETSRGPPCLALASLGSESPRHERVDTSTRLASPHQYSQEGRLVSSRLASTHGLAESTRLVLISGSRSCSREIVSESDPGFLSGVRFNPG